MRYFLPRSSQAVLMLSLVVLVVACSNVKGSTISHSTPAIPSEPTRVGTPSTLSPTIDMIAQQVLTNMHLHAWNPAAMTRGIVTGGLFINWKMDDPSVTNNTRIGSDGTTLHNHDPQVDLRYLTALAEYHLIHPQDHTYDTDLKRVTAVVLTDFQRYSLPKGWIYFYLLRAGLMLQESALVDEAHAVANDFYTNWYDPALGVVYNHVHTPGDYATNYTLECGTALIDAGLRWQRPDWVSAGEKTIDHTIAVALNPQYHLFYDSMVVSSDGHDQVQNDKARPSTEGEAVDTLVTAYTLTHRQQYLDVAGQVLQALFGSSGLWDQAAGGLFFAFDWSKGELLTNYKETRSQTLTLIGLHHYNQVRQQQFAQQERQLVTVLTDHFYQHTYHGFFYRVTPDFQVYVSRPGTGIGLEDYFTTEAMGSALDALQQTELTNV